jgi:uncharacterized protein YjbJ (UPF0337 family)
MLAQRQLYMGWKGKSAQASELCVRKHKGKPGNKSRMGLPERLPSIFQKELLMITESTKDRVEGKAREIKGKAKKAVGRAVNRPDIEQEGANEELGGKVQRKVGEVEKVLGS